MRATLRLRGPDQVGFQQNENWMLAHTRLAVRDTSHDGDQPMWTPDGRYHLVYNGELYNDAELRSELLRVDAVPGGFRSHCDTETVLWAFATWGSDAFAKLRGMFSIAIYDSRKAELHLARDPLGIKPLYYHHGLKELTFASEARAILAHPQITPEPDMAMASAYLSTLRSVIGARTMFKDVFAIEPGERAVYDAATGELNRTRFHHATPVRREWIDIEEAAEEAREVLTDSVAEHLNSDVPISALLSGGLDSTILCRITQDFTGGLHTWCSGGERESDDSEDFTFAQEAANAIGTQHREVSLDQERWARDWAWMIDELGFPLSTPNEVAIHAVCRDLRDRGRIVTISGEGADELFGGYELSMQAVADFQKSRQAMSGGAYQLAVSAWIAPPTKSQILTPASWAEAGEDAFLHDHYDCLFGRCEEEAGEYADPLEPHLRFLRHNNLTGLLQRLDTASMLASVEGRTPFADERVLKFAESLPMSCKFAEQETHSGGGTALMQTVRGKLVLRQALRGRIPSAIELRQKQSFSLPFQAWMSTATPVLERSSFAKEFFVEDIRRDLAGNPEQYWQCAWPMLNLALWGERWWG